MFINLVELIGVLLVDVHVDCFRQWVFLFGKNIVRFSSRLPLVSGFYKILDIIMVICDKINFFVGVNEFNDEQVFFKFLFLYFYFFLISFCLLKIKIVD